MHSRDGCHDGQPEPVRLRLQQRLERAEAEDVVQEAYVRWHQADETTIRNSEAWLVTTATRLAIALPTPSISR